MIARDDHDSALNAAPYSRHHPWSHTEKRLIFQKDRLRRRMMHNHPSGNPEPSRADIQITQRIMEAGRHLGITVHDHVIVGREGHASLRSKGLI